jgi:hypothetical protein
MRINPDESLKRAEQTFERFDGDWTNVYNSGAWKDGVFVVGTESGGDWSSTGSEKSGPDYDSPDWNGSK